MPRNSDVKSREQRQRYIRERLANPVDSDTIPQWESGERRPVTCQVILIPLDYLLYRIQNLRTLDAQRYATSESGQYQDSSIFDSDNEGAQETQDAQHELLVTQARRKDGREGNQDLFQILTTEGWSAEERPIITPSGVLINGNCRVATIEEILQKRSGGEEFEGMMVDPIDPNAPMIEVKVTPSEPVDEMTIIKLERVLQRPDRGRLNYDWIQITTDIRRMFELGMSEDEVFQEFQLYSRFDTKAKFRLMRNTRDLLDSLLAQLGRPGEAFALNTNVDMMMAAQKLLAKEAFSNSADNDQLKALILQMVQIVLSDAVQGYMYGNLNQIRNPDDVRRMLTDMEGDSGISVETIVEEEDPITGELTRRVEIDTDAITEMDSDSLRKRSRRIDDTASTLRRNRRDGDLQNRPKNKVNAAIDEVNWAMEAVDQASAQGMETDSEELRSKIRELKSQIRILEERIDDSQN